MIFLLFLLIRRLLSLLEIPLLTPYEVSWARTGNKSADTNINSISLVRAKLSSLSEINRFSFLTLCKTTCYCTRRQSIPLKEKVKLNEYFIDVDKLNFVKRLLLHQSSWTIL